MNLNARRVGLAYVITVLDARIDAAGAIQFKERMRDLTQSVRGRVILDLHNVSFVDSSGLGAIVACKKEMGEGQSLELAALNPPVQKVFALTRMDSVFVLHASADAAVHAKTA